MAPIRLKIQRKEKEEAIKITDGGEHGGMEEREEEQQISYLVTPPEVAWEKNQKDATSEAQEILCKWLGKYETIQPTQDS